MKNFSIAIYGSSLRENFDRYSDKDLLIVGASYDLLNEQKIRYENYGYSVATYTYDKLNYLSSKGSLFVEHLKREATILMDGQHRLEGILLNHKETVPSEQQVQESLNYFSVFNKVPDTTLGYAWFCDCFYVGLRNLLILKSAKQNVYNFSFLYLIQELKSIGEIEYNEYMCLRELRVLKKNYRDKVVEELPDKRFILQILAIADKLHLPMHPIFLTPSAFGSFTKDLLANESTEHYVKLRFTEMYYLTTGRYLKEINHIITNPQLYSLKFKDQSFINRVLDRIEEENREQGLSEDQGVQGDLRNFRIC